MKLYNNVLMENGEKSQTLSYEEYQENFKRRMNLRQLNLNVIGDDFMPRKKNAQIKVIQKFIGKLKTDNKNHQAILTELESLNLSKYLEQISNIIVSSINERQILFYVQVASKLNIEYEGFPSILIKDLIKYFNMAFESNQDNRQKLKAILLLTTELFVSGFAFSYKELIQMIKKSFKSGKNKKLNYPSEIENKLFIYFYSSNIFSTFLINFVEIFTKKVPLWVSSWIKSEKQTYKYPEALPVKMKTELTDFFSKYLTECKSILEEIRQTIKQYQETLMENLKLDGEFNKEKERMYIDIVEKFRETKRNLKTISEALGEPFDETNFEVVVVKPNQLLAKYIGKSQNAEIFEDEFQKEIYENLPDLVKEENKEAQEDDYKKFKERLENCKNVKDSNEVASQFALINNKKNRKILVKDVLQYRRQYQLVTPYLCRVVAIIHINFKDIGDIVNELLLPDFQKLKEATSNTFVVHDKKSRLLKYLCEFTKFKVIETDKMMNCVESLINDLNGYNIELMVSALQNVGLFLRLSEKSSNRFTFLLNKFENVIKKKSLPLFTTSQLINSINLLKPRKQIQKQMEHELTEVERQADSIMKLDIVQETDEMIRLIDILIKKPQGIEAIKISVLKAIENYDFLGNYNYAYLLNELNYPQVQNYIIDKAIEQLNKCLLNFENQKMMIWARFIAQLYKYKLIERAMLYSIMEDLMKYTFNQIGVLNAICTILDACIDYLDSKKMSKKNERFYFFVKLKKFIASCKYVPMLEEFQIIDIFNAFEPDLTALSIQILNDFITSSEKKMETENKEIPLAEELDKYLWKKKIKKKEQKEQKDTREEKEEVKKQTAINNASLPEVKEFEKQLITIIDKTTKDYSSRIAKSVFLQKNFQKKKEKKKEGPVITVIGRKGNKFVKKDVCHPKPQL